MNRRFLALAMVAGLSVQAFAQQRTTETTVRESTTVRTTETVAVDCDHDLLGPPLWSVNDAVPVPVNRMDLRFTGMWVTSNAPANGGDSDDDFIIVPHLVWGVAENLEIGIANSIWLGDSGDRGPDRDGNYDTHLSTLWRFRDQEGCWPAMALAGRARIPTGDGSSGVDGELRLILTNTYDSGIRSHFNAFGITVNGDNERSNRYALPENLPDSRHFQWGFVLGVDGPLSDDGSTRWVADYVHRSSYNYGSSNINLLELGIQWAAADKHAFGINTQIGLDDNEDTPNFGAGFTYSYSLCW